MRLSTYLIRNLTRETPHPALNSSLRIRPIATRRAHPRAQRGANLIESALAMGLVAIGVFATVSSFGDGTTSRISRGILPVIGGEPPSESEMSSPDWQSGQPDMGGLPLNLGGVPVGGSNEGTEEGIGGIVGNPPDGDEWNGGGENTFVGGTDAMPPTDDGGTNSSDSGSWSSEDSNTFVGGIVASPETGYQGGDASEGSNTSGGAGAPIDYYEGVAE